MRCRTEVSRPEVPGLPWKYLLATMLVAVCDQDLGTATFSWRKIVAPFSLAICAVRVSHSRASNGGTLPSVKNRSNTSPVRMLSFALACGDICELSVCVSRACFTVAILASAYRAPSSRRGTLLVYSPTTTQGYVVRAESIQFHSEFPWQRPARAKRKKRKAVPEPKNNNGGVTTALRPTLSGAERNLALDCLV